MQEEWERQEKLRMELETMEQVLDTSSYASTEGYYQGQGGYLAYPQYPDASYYTGGGAYAQSTESDSHSHDSYESYGSYQVPEIPGYTPITIIYANTDAYSQYLTQYEAYYQHYMSWTDYVNLMSTQYNVRFQ